VNSSSREFLEVNLLADYLVTGVITQGRFAQGLGQEFAEFFKIQYWRQGMHNPGGRKVLKGNMNTFTAARRNLTRPIIASKVRILPYSLNNRTVCMRVELLGCRYRGNFYERLILNHFESIPAPEPSERHDDWGEATFLGAAIGILVTMVLVLISGLVLVAVKNRQETCSRYSNFSSDTSGSIRREYDSKSDTLSSAFTGPSSAPRLLHKYSSPSPNNFNLPTPDEKYESSSEESLRMEMFRTKGYISADERSPNLSPSPPLSSPGPYSYSSFQQIKSGKGLQHILPSVLEHKEEGCGE